MDTSKIIIGTVGGGRYTVTAPIMQEHYGIILKIEGAELPETYQVDFSNDEHHGTSVTMIGNADGVRIPRQFIDTGKDIFAFLYWVGEDYGKTVYKFRIPNKVRPDRTNEEPTPEEQSVIDQAINALNEAVEKTAEDVESADQSARSASDDADRAEQARDDAQTYANNASASATASAQSASQSAQIKADVEDLVDDAQGYAQASAQSASASANSASQAQGFAQSASTSAQSASGYANNAQTSANTASAKAQDASTSAQTATQKATESAQSASQALAYKTDAESAKTASQTAQGLAESARDSAITAKTDAESAKADAETARDEAQQAVESISGALADKAPVITDTASGSIASFPDGADNLPLKSLVVNINPVQDLSQGDPSPENVCPISGWTEINAYNDPLHGGNIEWNQLVNSYRSSSINGLTFVTDANNKSISISGTITTAFSYNTITFTRNSPVKIKRDGRKYIIICNQATPYPIRIAGFIDCVSTGSYGGVFSDYIPKNQEFTNMLAFYAMEGDTFAVSNFTVQMFDLTTMFGAEIADYIYSLEQANAGAGVTWFKKLFPEDYYEYNEGEKTTVSAVNDKPYTHVNIQLGQTVYGGKLDVLSGELTVYPYYASYNGETLTGEWISDRDKYVSGTTPTIGAQVVNIGAQGVTVQLEPHEVESLYGVNNIWADSGDTEVEYRADTKLFIERLTAPDSADMIADANITSGKYFMVGNNLFKATSNIANGSAIIVGTNCIRKSLSEALNEINS